MSWLQSGLGFAKTAINQAQKSIDKVLDIKEDHDVLSAGMQVEEGISGPEPAPPTGATPSLGSWTTSLWSTPTKEEEPEESSLNQSTGKTESQPADTDSFWSSFFDSPSKKQSLTSPPSAMKKPPTTPSAGSTPKSHLQGKRESGQKVPNRKETKTSAKRPRRVLQTANESAAGGGGEGEPSLWHPPKSSSADTQEAGTAEQEASQPTPVREASITGTVPMQPTPASTASLEESGKEAPFSGGWQSQPLLSVDTMASATADSGTVGETVESEITVVGDECSSDKGNVVCTGGALTDLGAEVSEAAGQMAVARTEMEEGERTAGSPTKEEQPHDASQTTDNEVLLNQVDQVDEPGIEGAGSVASDEQGKWERDDWDGGWLEQTSPPPDVIPQGVTPEVLPTSTAVECVGENVMATASTEMDKPSTPSESGQPGVSEDTDISNAPAPGHVLLQQLLPGSGSAEDEQVAEGGTGFSPLPLAAELASSEEVLSTVKPDTDGDNEPSEEFQKREEPQRCDDLEEEQPQSSTREQATPCRVATEDSHGNLLGEDQPLDRPFLSSPEGRREEQEAEFMTPAAALGPPSSAGSQADLESQLKSVQEELRQTRHVLEVREQKLMDLSQANANLNEDNDGLRSELAFAQEQQRSGESSTEELKEEFTQRISATEKKLTMVLKEKEALKKQLQGVETQRSSMSDKDEEIAALREEGEKLSKQQLQNSNTMKKLRAKDQENKKLIAGLKQKLESADVEVGKLKEALQKREESERGLQETLSKLNAFAEQQNQELTSVKTERGGLLDKSRSLQTNLDNVFKELADLKKASAASDNAVKEAALSAEISAKEELKATLEQHRRETLQEKDQLLMQIADLRAGLGRADQQASWREDQLRQEIAALQNRLQEAESRNEDLSASVSQATKPLLRQLENLQAIHSTQTANWEMVEGSLTERLGIAQAHASEAMEKEREFAEKEMTLQSRLTSLEAQVKGLRQDKTKQDALLEAEKAKLAAAEEGSQKSVLKLETFKATHTASLEQLRKEKENIERQLDYERASVESKVMEATAKAQEKERQKVLAELEVSGMKRLDLGQHDTGLARSVSVESSGSFWESSFSKASQHSGVTTAPLLEHYQSQLRQKEGELANTHSLLSSVERSRSALTEEVAKLAAENEALEERVKTIPGLQTALKEMHTRNETLLQMYGEISERAEELRLDLMDVKEMYKQQIQDLLDSGKSSQTH